jgi:hypothetical protein
MTTDAGPAIREFVAGRYPQADFAATTSSRSGS